VAKVFDKKWKIKLITDVFFFWSGRWSFDPGVKSFFLRCGCWIFNLGKSSFYPEDRNPSWNQEPTCWRGMKQKIAILILSSCVFQYLTENGVIFVMWKHIDGVGNFSHSILPLALVMCFSYLDMDSGIL
jgi:hypothetical protein